MAVNNLTENYALTTNELFEMATYDLTDIIVEVAYRINGKYKSISFTDVDWQKLWQISFDGYDATYGAQGQCYTFTPDENISQHGLRDIAFKVNTTGDHQ